VIFVYPTWWYGLPAILKGGSTVYGCRMSHSPADREPIRGG
jgi:hypothetical protein